jgi:N-hydroxyarylamine O-acetyltransferase
VRVAEDPDLSGWLSRAEAEAFVERLGMRFERADFATLGALLRAYLGKVPFQNVGMLARWGRAPTVAELLDDMRGGRGGPCNVMNPFLAALLSRLGYDVSLLSGTMQQPDCHIALLVRCEGRACWLDVGNGHPYLEPVALGDEAPRLHAGLTYRLTARPEPDTYAVEHSVQGGPWRTSYTFLPVSRPLRFFARMIEQHHTEPGFGPFLSGLRIIRFPDGEMTAIRDDVFLTGGEPLRKTRLESRGALLDVLREHFPDVDLPISEALRSLERAGRPLFSDARPLSPHHEEQPSPPPGAHR